MAKSRRKKRRKRNRRGDPQARATRPRLSDEERELERLVDEVRARAAEALSPDTPPERVAEVLVEDFESLPSPVGLVRTLREDGAGDRASAVATETQRLAPGSVTALTMAAEVARTVDEDPERASALLDEALDAQLDPDGVAVLARHLLEADRAVDALALLEDGLTEPEDEDEQEVHAWALEDVHRRGGRLGREALDRFSDRGLLYRLREALGEYVDERPELRQLIAGTVRAWLEELREAEDDEHAGGLALEEAGGGGLEERHEGILRLAVEHAWLLDGDVDEEYDEEQPFEPAPELEESDAPLALLATDPHTPPELAHAARGWLETYTCGLWQVADPDPAPGLWLTDIVSGVRRYASIAPEQVEGASRWSVWMGALVSLDGRTWRSTGALVPMRPAEADWAAELAREATTDVVKALAGKRVRGRTARRKAPEPHGVLVEQAPPAPPEVARLMSQVLGNLIPGIAGETWRRRNAGPTLTNMEGHRLKSITARVAVKDERVALRRLAAHEDFKTEDEGTLTWWGRELTAMEQESARAQLRSQFGEEPDEPDETPRLLRGRLKPRKGGFEVEVNSEERLTLLLDLLGELGLEPEVGRRSAIDPAQDMPPIQAGGPLPFGASQEAIDAWLSHWPDERVPALDNLTPRAVARREKKRPRLEALLREFEHDSYLLARQGRAAPNVGRLRAELGMERWME